jgi:hypothetical protein
MIKDVSILSMCVIDNFESEVTLLNQAAVLELTAFECNRPLVFVSFRIVRSFIDHAFSTAI